MGRIADFKALVKSGKPLSGTFLKTPHHNMIEVMAQSGLDFVCLDAEHAPLIARRLMPAWPYHARLITPFWSALGIQARAKFYGPWIAVPRASWCPMSILLNVPRKLRAQLGLAKAAVDLRARRVGVDLAPKKWPTYWNGRNRKPLCSPDRRRLCRAPIDQIAAIDGIDALFAGPLILRSAWAIRQ